MTPPVGTRRRVRVGTLRIVSAGCLVTLMVTGHLGVAAEVAAAGLLVDGALARWRRWSHERLLRRRGRAVPALYSGVATQLRAGADPTAAVDRAEQAAGGGLLLTEEVSALTSMLEICADTGAAPASLCAELAAAAAAQEAARVELQDGLAAVEASTALLMALPVAGLLLAEWAGTSALPILLRTGPGRLCLVAGVLLLRIGHAWTDALVGRAAHQAGLR